jgi:hypothetical protein
LKGQKEGTSHSTLKAKVDKNLKKDSTCYWCKKKSTLHDTALHWHQNQQTCHLLILCQVERPWPMQLILQLWRKGWFSYFEIRIGSDLCSLGGWGESYSAVWSGINYWMVFAPSGCIVDYLCLVGTLLLFFFCS